MGGLILLIPLITMLFTYHSMHKIWSPQWWLNTRINKISSDGNWFQVPTSPSGTDSQILYSNNFQGPSWTACLLRGSHWVPLIHKLTFSHGASSNWHSKWKISLKNMFHWSCFCQPSSKTASCASYCAAATEIQIPFCPNGFLRLSPVCYHVTASESFSITNGYVRNSQHLQNPLGCWFRAIKSKWKSAYGPQQPS
jgi:hypothetical protein